ncbi:MAG TPA: DoxX family protein [Gemmatimonadales bacterium]|nr:DoxX family protein [Gemmatimonadales bacterium]
MNRSQDAALLLARLLVAALLLPGGINKLLNFSKFAASLAAKGVPYSKLVAMLNVAVEVVGPIALIIGLWPLLTALALIALTLVTTWTTYRFGVFGAVFKHPQPVVLMKNLAVIAGLLFYAVSGPGAWSRTSLRRA